MRGSMPRILFAAPKSGSGKTMITCGMIEICKRRALKTVSVKCGPDYIDPMFHRRVLGVDSGNLDTFFTGEEMTRYLLQKKAKDAEITIMEGVMGYYDGLGGTTERASTYEVAKVTRTPVILIVDGKGASVSLAAVIRGILEYRSDSNIRGILLNRVSPGYYGRLKELIERECGVKVLGFLPELKGLQVPSRHLGLIAPQEMEAFHDWIREIADAMERTVELDQLLAIAGEAPALSQAEDCERKGDNSLAHLRLKRRVRLAVARDEAFSFYYSENLELLKEMGAELVEFSPLHDTALPEALDGLLLGGGYPERYAKQLEEASAMRESIRTACERGLPCLAECGGFLYLQKELLGEDGVSYEMAGVLEGRGFRTDKLCRFGYIELEGFCNGLPGEEKQSIRGHEFHYWDCTENGDAFKAVKPVGGGSYPCMVSTANILAGFPHLYYYSNPELIWEFLQRCLSFQAKRLAKAHWDSIAKPIDSLGLLEDYVGKLCGIAGDASPYPLKKRALLILCGDHGVVDEGVTQTGREVTRIVSENFAKGCSTVNYMSRSAGADVYTIDVGIDCPAYPQKELVCGAVIDRKLARGCGNILREPAMTRQLCLKALKTGMELVKELKGKGYTILATGEMGIGNTTPTSVLAALLLGLTAKEVTGKGAGLSPEGFEKKRKVVAEAVERVRKLLPQKPWQQLSKENVIDVLAQAGGLEIAAMAGVFLGGAAYRIPIVIDGAISSVAALTALGIDPRVKDFVLASHQSEEVTGRLALQALGADAVLHGKMCLGEGTGAVALFPLLDMAMEVYSHMGTFTEYEITPYVRYEEDR